MGKLVEFFAAPAARIDSSHGLFKLLLEGNESHSGQPVSLERSMKVAAVSRCVRLIAEGIAGLSWITYRDTEDGRERAEGHWAYRLFKQKPSKLYNSVEWLELQMTHLLLRGNAFAYKLRGANGYEQLIPIDSRRISKAELLPGSEDIEYTIEPAEGTTGASQRLRRDKIFHIKGLSTDGILGRSVIQDARESFGLALATEEHSAKTFKNGARPGATLETDLPLSQEQRNVLKEHINGFNTRMNAGETLILDSGMKFNPVSMSMADAQVIEMMNWTVTDVCRFFGVPPHLAFLDIKQPRANMEQAHAEFEQYGLKPWAERIEHAANDQLLNNGSVFTEFEFNSAMRTAFKERWEAYSIAVQNGIMNRNEARKKENMNRIPGDEGDKYTIQTNMGGINGQPAQPPVRQ